MAFYLQMDGVDDYLVTPSVTFDKVIMEVTVDGTSTNSTFYVVDARGGTNTDASSINNPFAYVTKTDMTLTKGPGVLTMSVDSVSVSSKVLVSNQRYLVEFTFKHKTDPALEFFINYARQTNTATKGKIYNIKVYDGTTVVAHYDMSTQTVQDQSGNGKHATLTGGTWVEDTGGVIVHTASGTASGTTNLTANVSQTQTATATINGTSQVSVVPSQVQTASGVANGTSSVSANLDGLILIGTGESSGVATVTGTCTLLKTATGQAQGTSDVSSLNPLRTLSGSGEVNSSGWAVAQTNWGGAQRRNRKIVSGFLL